MIVPNYIPEPLEVPGNVTEQPYPVRVRFIRVATLLFAGSVLGTAGLATVLPEVPLLGAVAALAGILVLLEVWRIATRGRPIEGKVSGALLPVVLMCLAWCLQGIAREGWPIWQLLAAPACIAIYTVLAGRDYSFIGNFFLSLIFSSVGVALVAKTQGLSVMLVLFSLATNAAVLAYVLYDLASLMSRRRASEPLAAVTDLYRDVLNFFGYFVRVLRHWHRHRILSLPNAVDLRWKGKS